MFDAFLSFLESALDISLFVVRSDLFLKGFPSFVDWFEISQNMSLQTSGFFVRLQEISGEFGSFFQRLQDFSGFVSPLSLPPDRAATTRSHNPCFG